MSDNHKFFLFHGRLVEQSHITLQSLASEFGKDIPTMASELIERGMMDLQREMKENGQELPAEAAVFAELRRINKRKEMKRSLQSIAIAYKESGDDDDAERFKDLCDKSNISVEAVLQELNDKPHLEAFISQNERLSNVEEFFLKIMKPGEPYIVQEIKNLAIEAGFSNHKIKEAKTRLGIESHRDGQSRLWILPIKQNTDI